MASGHVNRIKRPDTWLHRPMLQNVKKALANPEPSTHDPKATLVGPSNFTEPHKTSKRGVTFHEAAGVHHARGRRGGIMS